MWNIKKSLPRQVTNILKDIFAVLILEMQKEWKGNRCRNLEDCRVSWANGYHDCSGWPSELLNKQARDCWSQCDFISTLKYLVVWGLWGKVRNILPFLFTRNFESYVPRIPKLEFCTPFFIHIPIHFKGEYGLERR